MNFDKIKKKERWNYLHSIFPSQILKKNSRKIHLERGKIGEEQLKNNDIEKFFSTRILNHVNRERNFTFELSRGILFYLEDSLEYEFLETVRVCVSRFQWRSYERVSSSILGRPPWPLCPIRIDVSAGIKQPAAVWRFPWKYFLHAPDHWF